MAVEHGSSELIFYAVLGEEASEDGLHQFITIQGDELGAGSLKGWEALEMFDGVLANRYNGR